MLFYILFLIMTSRSTIYCFTIKLYDVQYVHARKISLYTLLLRAKVFCILYKNFLCSRTLQARADRISFVKHYNTLVYMQDTFSQASAPLGQARATIGYPVYNPLVRKLLNCINPARVVISLFVSLLFAKVPFGYEVIFS